MHCHWPTTQPGALSSSYWLKRPAVPPLPWSSPVITIAAFASRGRNQKRGSGLRSTFIRSIRFVSRRCCSSACGIWTLSRLTQSGCSSSFLAAEEEVIRADRSDPISVFPSPGWIPLPGVDHRLREVIAECRGLAAFAADAAQGHRRVRGRRTAGVRSRESRSSGRPRSCSGRRRRGTGSSGRRCPTPGPVPVSTFR